MKFFSGILWNFLISTFQRLSASFLHLYWLVSVFVCTRSANTLSLQLNCDLRRSPDSFTTFETFLVLSLPFSSIPIINLFTFPNGLDIKSAITEKFLLFPLLIFTMLSLRTVIIQNTPHDYKKNEKYTQKFKKN